MKDRLEALLLQLRLNEDSELSKEQLEFIALHPQIKYSVPFICVRKTKKED